MPLSSVCLIVPVYNEYNRMAAATYTAFMAAHRQVHMIFVNDASIDDTESVLLQIKNAFPAQVDILNHKVRAGKAEAIRTGMLRGLENKAYSYFAFIDADLAVPLDDILLFVQRLDDTHSKLAFGTRADSNKLNINRTALRNIMGNIFRTYLHSLLRFSIADSQCGAKVFAADIVPVLYQSPFRTRWLSDVELMIRYCDHLNIKREDVHRDILQVPVSKFEDKADSKVNGVELIRTLKELIIISLPR